MNVLVRLPNWLGDVVMSLPFLAALKKELPQSSLDVIVKSDLQDLLKDVPGLNRVYAYTKQDHPGLWGAAAFGRTIAAANTYALYFCLPDSFSSALMGWASKSQTRIGYKKEVRGFLLTQAVRKNENQHRAQQYCGLLEAYLGKPVSALPAALPFKSHEKIHLPKGTNLVLNINAVGPSRQMPVGLAVELIRSIRSRYGFNILLTGTRSETATVASVLEKLESQDNIYDFSGQTSLSGLITLLQSVDLVLSTDSGLAHLANALGQKTLVLFGAGDDNNTRPFNKKNLAVVRKAGVPCAPCVSNTCKLGTPICLTEMDPQQILNELESLIRLKVVK